MDRKGDKMKAEELFEKLGYKKQVGFESICFIYENEDTVNFEIIFDLKNKNIHTHGGYTDKSLSMDELNAIKKQCEELDWVGEKICTNFSSGQGEFMCSNCGIYLDDLSQIVIPESCNENVKQDEYELRYCPNCGCKIVDYQHFAKKAKYKVTQFEFDLLNTYRFCKEECKFRDCTQLRELKVIGYYKDVDADAKIRDILWNCGVIKDENC